MHHFRKHIGNRIGDDKLSREQRRSGDQGDEGRDEFHDKSRLFLNAESGGGRSEDDAVDMTANKDPYINVVNEDMPNAYGG